MRQNDVLKHAIAWRNTGHEVAVATVVSTWGSSPRPVGSQLAVNDSGEFVGSVSGGCVEGAVVHEAQEIIKGEQPRLLEFSVGNEMAWEVGLTCGGTIEVFVAPLAPPPLLDRLMQNRNERRPAVIITDLESGEPSLVDEDGHESSSGEHDLMLSLVVDGLHSVVSEVRETDAGKYFIHSFPPLPRMMIVGAVHVAQALAPMAVAVGFDVTVIDPRRAFATNERFAGVTIEAEWPKEVLSRIRPDRATAIISLTHDPKIDDPALISALGSDAFYIGALGSRKTHAKRMARLREAGIPEADLARIHAPIGLDLGGKNAAEIAISIMAEVVQAKYR